MNRQEKKCFFGKYCSLLKILCLFDFSVALVFTGVVWSLNLRFCCDCFYSRAWSEQKSLKKWALNKFLWFLINSKILKAKITSSAGGSCGTCHCTIFSPWLYILFHDSSFKLCCFLSGDGDIVFFTCALHVFLTQWTFLVFGYFILCIIVFWFFSFFLVV